MKKLLKKKKKKKMMMMKREKMMEVKQNIMKKMMMKMKKKMMMMRCLGFEQPDLNRSERVRSQKRGGSARRFSAGAWCRERRAGRGASCACEGKSAQGHAAAGEAGEESHRPAEDTPIEEEEENQAQEKEEEKLIQVRNLIREENLIGVKKEEENQLVDRQVEGEEHQAQGWR